METKLSKKKLDHTLIFGATRADPDKPNYGLYNRGDSWLLLYYNDKWVSRQMHLGTKDVEEARALRDDLYRRARAIGRGLVSKQQYYAMHILDNPETDHGIKYVVYKGNRVVSCHSLKQARAERARICREILANPVPAGKRFYLKTQPRKTRRAS